MAFPIAFVARQLNDEVLSVNLTNLTNEANLRNYILI